MEEKHNDLIKIITQVLNEMKGEQGECFDINIVNLTELEQRTSIIKAKLRRIKEYGSTFDKENTLLFFNVIERHQNKEKALIVYNGA